MKSHNIAIPFFSEEQWARARAVMEDNATLHDSYAEFVKHVIDQEAKLRAQGKFVVRIHIDPEVFAQWCRASGRKVNAESRSIYADLKAAQTYSGREN